MDRYLILEDGSGFKGTAFGADKEISGEVVFSTGMVGYPEALTDSSYTGQLLVLTYPLIGNYGVPGYQKKNGVFTSFESASIKVRGLIVSSYVDQYSHWEAKKSLDSWLNEEGIPAIAGVDTRLLTIKLREKGVMLGGIFRSLQSQTSRFEDPNKDNLVSRVSIKKPRILGKGKKKVLVLDCGIKEGILANLIKRDVSVLQVPWDFDPFENNLNSFDGVLISNGPGDPKMVKKTVTTVKRLMNKKVPLLGICLGNQILALASGADTYKMKFGHRSHNQPVELCGTRRCFLTTQNHGFAIKENSLTSGWQLWFKNLNDRTIEGIKHKTLPFISVQFHPEGRPGPEDTNWVFDEFIKHVTQKMLSGT